MFGATIHELHHLTSPIRQNPETPNAQEKIRGLGLLRPDLVGNKENMICYNTIRGSLEEAIVQDSSDRMCMKLGIRTSPSDDYTIWVQRYRNGVIDRFFSGNHKLLLVLHQETRPNEFFSLIGEKLGFPSDQSRIEGERYVGRLIMQGVM